MTIETIGNTKMSIEQKAKAYDEALERAKKQLEDAKVFDYKDGQIAYDIRTTTYAIFPELKESEDERIRKALITLTKVPRKAIFEAQGITKEQALAWLEKQKEQKPEKEQKNPVWNNTKYLRAPSNKDILGWYRKENGELEGCPKIVWFCDDEIVEQETSLAYWIELPNEEFDKAYWFEWPKAQKPA